MGQNIVPRNAALRRAVRWLSEQRTDSKGADVAALIDQASLRFDLSPLEAKFLSDQFGRPGVPGDRRRTR